MLFGLSTLSLFKAGASAELLAHVARSADELGFDSMWMGHHVIFETEMTSPYPYGHNPMTSATPRLDTWITLTYLAAVTKRLRFGSAVYLTPLINPLITARAVMSADYLSGGRMLFGMGVGWNREEFAMLEQDFSTRGARTDEIVDILRKLFTEQTITHEGAFYNFGPVNFEPKPIQRPWPPMLYGGMSPRALARAARLDGCVLPTNDFAEIKAALDSIQSHREKAGTCDQPFDITVAGPFPLTPASLEPLIELGVNRVNFDVGTNPLDPQNPLVPIEAEALTRNLERMAEHFLR